LLATFIEKIETISMFAVHLFSDGATKIVWFQNKACFEKAFQLSEKID